MTLSFLLTSLIVVASPGTGVLYTLAVALTSGARPSIAAAFGCTLGIVPQMLAAMLGLAAVLHTSALAFAALKWCGCFHASTAGTGRQGPSGGEHQAVIRACFSSFARMRDCLRRDKCSTKTTPSR